MLRDTLRLDAPELGAFHVQTNVRSASLRVGLHRGGNVASDYALLQRVSPFLHHLTRPALTVLLAGEGRFEEGERRVWLRPGDIVRSDQARAGTEAYSGERCLWLVMDWDPAACGAGFDGPFAVDRLASRDRSRLERAIAALEGPAPDDAVADVVAALRAAGLAFAPPDEPDAPSACDATQRLQRAINERLSQLDAHPALDDLADELGWNDRRLHRHVNALAKTYRLPWDHWRSALHHTRLLQALRLLAAPGATTEQVARLTGFRGPSALCHALGRGGLPSPGALHRAARGYVLDGWAAFSDARPNA